MNKLITILSLLCLMALNTVQAQDGNMEEEIDDKGFYLGASLMGTSFSLDLINDNADTGGGIGIEAGYNFNTNFAVFLSFDGSGMKTEDDDTYALAHFDLGAEGRLGDYDDSFRPFARVSVLGAAAAREGSDGDIEITGGGLGAGVGLHYFVNPKMAFKLGYTHSWININEVKVGSVSVEVDENANSGRLGLGFTYHF